MSSLAASAGAIHLGMDTSKNTIVVAVLLPGEEVPVIDRMWNEEGSVRHLVGRFPDRAALWACYEAGPCGLPALVRSRNWPDSVCGRLRACLKACSVPSLSRFGAGSCERAAGAWSAQRPRSGAAGVLDTAARERIMPGGGQGAPGWRLWFSGSGWWPFYAGEISRGGRGRGQEQPALPRSAGRRWYPGDMMIDCCDVRSHVVSESVEGGWLMPGT